MEGDTEKNKAKTPTLRVTNLTAGRVGAKSGAPEKSEGQFGIQWVAHPPTKETTHL
jgi:hypothetical protein